MLAFNPTVDMLYSKSKYACSGTWSASSICFLRACKDSAAVLGWILPSQLRALSGRKPQFYQRTPGSGICTPEDKTDRVSAVRLKPTAPSAPSEMKCTHRLVEETLVFDRLDRAVHSPAAAQSTSARSSTATAYRVISCRAAKLQPPSVTRVPVIRYSAPWAACVSEVVEKTLGPLKAGETINKSMSLLT